MSQSWPPLQWPPERQHPRYEGRARMWIFLAVLGLVPAVGLFAAHRLASAKVEDARFVSVAPEPPAGRVVTPLASMRRAPSTVRQELATDALVAALGPVGQQVPEGSCLVVGVDGRPVFDDAGGTSIIPASNMKIVTAAVGLEVLGPDHRFTTDVKADAAPADGVVGDLYLVGGGDPVLGTEPYVAAAAAQVNYPQPYVTPLELLADQIVAAGITRVDGAVQADDGRYDAERFVPSWPPSYAAEREAGPLGALMVNDAAASLQPLRSAEDPGVHAATVLTRLLRERGVQVAGEAGRAVTPPAAVGITALQSRPLSELVGEMLTTSDDNTAELLLKEIGVATGGGGSRVAGLGAVQATLEAWGIPTAGLVFVDGSGLDRNARLTCRVLEGVLAHVGPSGPVADGLPVAGRTGTLAAAFLGNPAEGRLRAKTGTLTGARALSGYVDAPDGTRHISFSYIQNGPDADRAAIPVWDALGRVLTTYPAAPPLEQLDPEPAAPPG